ncbi:MAG: efflux RND transporter periplasmic adaptor subunit [Candidatus Nealsonbacteria bacterium]|nr:efflux RND transporter periplasmic adaptor subunit [Candidatus Nealsonbacteria bacterium]
MSQRRNPIKRWLWHGLKLALVVAVVGYVIYLVRFSPVPVTGHKIERGEIVAEVMGTGTLEARVRATISPKISGRIMEVVADQGDRVTKGDVLVQLDNDELAQQVEIAQATVATSRAAVERLKTDRGRAVAVAEQAKRQYHRVQQLINQNVSTESALDKAVESVAVADAGLARANAAIVEGQQQVLTAEKTLAYHHARLADTAITVPFDGLIVRRQRDPGDVVVPGSSILQLVSLEQLWISAWIDETEMAHIDVGQPARVIFRSEPERSYAGEVTRLGKEADRETREFIVDVHVHELPANWAVGQRAEVYIETARKSSVTLLPTSFVRWQDNAPGVFVNLGDRAAWRSLTLGLRSPETVEVVDGLQPGDTVIVPQDPRATLTDGKRTAAP